MQVTEWLARSPTGKRTPGPVVRPMPTGTPRLAQWFEHYLDDTGWWVAAEEGEDVDEMSLWPHARKRAG